MSISRQQLLDFLRDELRVDTGQLEDDTLLFSSRLVDSFSMVDLILFLETSGKFKMKPTQVNLDNLDSVERILRFCGQQTGAGGPSSAADDAASGEARRE